MAAYLELSVKEAEAIAARYGLGVMLAAPIPISDGFNNSLFEIKTNSGDYVLKIYEDSIDPFAVTSLQERHDFQKACFKNGVPVAELVGGLGEYKGKALEVMRKVEGTHLDHMDTEKAKKLGKLIARFHVQSKNTEAFSTQKLPGGLGLIGKELASSFKRATESGNVAGEILYASMMSLAVIEKMYKMLSLPKHHLPKGKVHGDINASNILEDRHGKLHLLDMERANEGLWINDMAQAILKCCRLNPKEVHGQTRLKNQLDASLVESFLEGYDSVRKITPQEAEMLPHHIYGQARFYELVGIKLNLVGRTIDMNLDPTRLRLELQRYDFLRMTDHQPLRAVA